MVSCLKQTYEINKSDALLITDIQKDFLPGGALPVSGGDEIIPALNWYARFFESAKGYVFASRDWHPANHVSFKAQGGLWPLHCVQNTKGANFSPDLILPGDTGVISKAMDPKKEGYSVFDGTLFADELRIRGVKRLFVGGLATDYCVVNTVIDSRKLGYDTVVLMDATMGINVKPDDVDKAIQAMLKAGAQQATMVDFSDAVEKLTTAQDAPDAMEEESSERAAVKKKSRMRPKGSSKRVRTEK